MTEGNHPDVPLRDYLERIWAEHDRRHGTEHDALKLQATEYERRLNLLNHAYERSIEDRKDFLSIEKYEVRHEELIRRINQLEHDSIPKEQRDVLIERLRLLEASSATEQALQSTNRDIENNRRILRNIIIGVSLAALLNLIINILQFFLR